MYFYINMVKFLDLNPSGKTLDFFINSIRYAIKESMISDFEGFELLQKANSIRSTAV